MARHSNIVYKHLCHLVILMPRTKVTRNRQVTIPAEIAMAAEIRQGDILDVRYDQGRVVLEKAKEGLPKIKIGRRLSDKEIERLTAEAATEVSG